MLNGLFPKENLGPVEVDTFVSSRCRRLTENTDVLSLNRSLSSKVAADKKRIIEQLVARLNEQHPNVHSLDLCWNSLTLDVVKGLTELKHVTSVILKYNNLPEDDCKAFAELMGRRGIAISLDYSVASAPKMSH